MTQKIAYYSLLIFSLVNFISPTLKSIMVISLISAWLISLLFKQTQLINPQTKILNYLAFVLLLHQVIRSFISDGSILSILSSNLFGEYVFWFAVSSLLYINSNNQRYQTYLKLSITSGSLITALYIILQASNIIPQHSSGVMGILSQPFTSSGLLIIGVFLTLDLKEDFNFIFPAKKSPLTKLFYFLLFTEIIAIVILGQVTVWAALFIALIFYFLKTKAIDFKKIGIASLILIMTLFLAQSISPRIERKLKWFTSFEKLTTNKSISCRYAIWQLNLDALKTNLWLGLGSVVKYECKIKDDSSTLSHMHNIFLQKLIEGGLVKLVIWFSFYICMFWTLLKNNKQNYLPMLCILIALSLEGLLENWWGDSEVVQLMLLTLAMYTCTAQETSHEGSSG